MKRLASLLTLLTVVASPLYARGALPPRVVTPEPATLGLLAAGLGALGVGAWMRSRRGR
jgi:hypothetical protein